MKLFLKSLVAMVMCSTLISACAPVANDGESHQALRSLPTGGEDAATFAAKTY